MNMQSMATKPLSQSALVNEIANYVRPHIAKASLDPIWWFWLYHHEPSVTIIVSFFLLLQKSGLFKYVHLTKTGYG